MGQNKKPRNKKYTPPMMVPGGNMTSVLIRFSAAEQADLQRIPREALQQFRKIEAVQDDWTNITQRLNLARVLAARHVSEPEAIAAIDKALTMMVELDARHRRVGKWGATPVECDTIAEGLDVADQIDPLVTRREMRDAMMDTLRESAVL